MNKNSNPSNDITTRGLRSLLTAVHDQNMTVRELRSLLFQVDEQDASAAASIARTAPAREVRSPWDNSIVKCSSCSSTTFYSLGRTLDYFNHECASCGEEMRTLTETGMSA